MKETFVLARNLVFGFLCVFAALPLQARGYQQVEPRPDNGQGLALLDGGAAGATVENSGWVDLYGDHAYEEFFAVRQDNGAYDLAIASRRNGKNALLYKQAWNLENMEDFVIEFFERDTRPQILLAHQAGGGGFLDVSILEYDGGALKTVYQTDEIGEDGWYYFVNKRILFSGGGGKYALSFKDGRYRLIPHNNMEGFTAPNTLRCAFRQDQFGISFNNSPLNFVPDDDNEAYSAEAPLTVARNEWILLNDNLNGSVSAGATPPAR
ncbi:MAG: hypothetical protein LBS86_05350 [Treponema sp.]|jgi:hypothetical protein|nr:hypothetical protein [Treponema sp.]